MKKTTLLHFQFSFLCRKLARSIIIYTYIQRSHMTYKPCKKLARSINDLSSSSPVHLFTLRAFRGCREKDFSFQSIKITFDKSLFRQLRSCKLKHIYSLTNDYDLCLQIKGWSNTLTKRFFSFQDDAQMLWEV